ncbi:hypothetical protein [Streptomyces sp. NRRL B-24484]|uniref:hypothetical protein n=1 Tax=Streptomyces sp. NRRL B-24484 TaxID=1463833 RepID=UPI0004C033DD|nr:hypothetical protein [Streptomyces sp. NRRL B-24484]
MIEARLVAALPAPLRTAGAGAPEVVGPPGRRVLLQRDDAELVAVRLDEAAVPGERVSFPAPWPRRYGTATVAPDLGLAVFAGTHALRAVDRTGAVRWEIRHGCWEDGCFGLHTSFEEYGGTDDHRRPNSGSAAFSSAGSLLWAHVRTEAGEEDWDDHAWEEWLLVDPADGRVLARTGLPTAAEASSHVPHPDPARMGLGIGEGQDGVPLYRGRWDGTAMTAVPVGDGECIPQAVSPSGERLLTVSHYQESLRMHRTADGSDTACLDADGAVPRHPAAPDRDAPRWDHRGGFLDEAHVLAGTAESDEPYGRPRHWLLSADPLAVLDEIGYPVPPSGAPTPLGNGTWTTLADPPHTLNVWRLPPA